MIHIALNISKKKSADLVLIEELSPQGLSM